MRSMSSAGWNVSLTAPDCTRESMARGLFASRSSEVITMTGMSRQSASFCKAATTAKPSISGIIKSSKIKSGGHGRALLGGRQAPHGGRRQRLRYGRFRGRHAGFQRDTTRGSEHDQSPLCYRPPDDLRGLRDQSAEAQAGEEPLVGARPSVAWPDRLLRGEKKLDFKFTLTMAAYDLIKLPRLIGVAA